MFMFSELTLLVVTNIIINGNFSWGADEDFKNLSNKTHKHQVIVELYGKIRMIFLVRSHLFIIETIDKYTLYI